MDPNTLRGEILRRVAEHEATGSNECMEDRVLATAIGVPLADVRRQIRLLTPEGT